MPYVDKSDFKQKKHVPIQKPKSAWKTDEEKSISNDEDEVRFWLRQISKSRDEAKDWVNECKDAWREYQAESLKDGKYRKLVAGTCSVYPRYWSDTMVMLPATYSQPPTVVARRRFDEDPVARTASILLERLAEYLIDSCEFDAEMMSAALEFLHCNRATTRLFFDVEIKTRAKRVSLQAVEEQDAETGEPITSYVTESGDYAPEDAVIQTDEEGQPFYEVEGEEEEIEYPKIYVKTMRFDEVFTSSGARNQRDLWWQGFKITTTRKQAHERFGAVIKDIKGPGDKKDEEGEETKPDDLFTFYEVWDYRERKVYWVHELLKEKFLDKQDDIYGLCRFYPTPRFMVSTPRYDSLYPTPDFTQTKDAYEQLHLLAQRINIISRAIKGVALYDGEQLELDRLFKELVDGEGIAVTNFKDLLGKGGLDSLIMFPPYERLAQTLQQLISAFTFWKEAIDEIRGVSDIIRGSSDPVTSATAERIKKQMASNRFSLRQKEMARFVRDTIELMCDLALSMFTDQQLMDCVGYPYLDPEDQQRFPEAIAMLQDYKARLVRVDIETDSLIAVDEEEDKAAANELLAALGQHLPGMVQAVQQMPEISEVVFKTFEQAVSKFRHGKHAEDELKQSFSKLTEKLQTQMPPPPPDPKMMELQLKQQQAESDTQLEQARLQLEGQKLSQDAQLKQWMASLDAGVKQAETTIKQQLANLEERKQAFDEYIKSMGLNIEAESHSQEMAERWAEEQRLSQGLALEQVKQQLPEAPQQQAPSVLINVAAPVAPEPTVVPVPVAPTIPGVY